MLTVDSWRPRQGAAGSLVSASHDDDFAACRREIDHADDLLLAALQQRAEAVKRLVQLKRARGVATYDPAREDFILARAAQPGHLFPADRRRGIFAVIIQHMREWQVTLD